MSHYTIRVNHDDQPHESGEAAIAILKNHFGCKAEVKDGDGWMEWQIETPVDATIKTMTSIERDRALERAQANMSWLSEQTDAIQFVLCPEFTGTWRMRAERAVEAARTAMTCMEAMGEEIKKLKGEAVSLNIVIENQTKEIAALRQELKKKWNDEREPATPLRKNPCGSCANDGEMKCCPPEVGECKMFKPKGKPFFTCGICGAPRVQTVVDGVMYCDKCLRKRDQENRMSLEERVAYIEQELEAHGFWKRKVRNGP